MKTKPQIPITTIIAGGNRNLSSDFCKVEQPSEAYLRKLEADRWKNNQTGAGLLITANVDEAALKQVDTTPQSISEFIWKLQGTLFRWRHKLDVPIARELLTMLAKYDANAFADAWLMLNPMHDNTLEIVKQALDIDYAIDKETGAQMRVAHPEKALDKWIWENGQMINIPDDKEKTNEQ